MAGEQRIQSSVAAEPSKLQSLVGCEGLKLVANGNAADRLFETRQKRFFALAAIEIEQKRFHRPDCGGESENVR